MKRGPEKEFRVTPLPDHFTEMRLLFPTIW